jgi:hypothetical protein
MNLMAHSICDGYPHTMSPVALTKQVDARDVVVADLGAAHAASGLNIAGIEFAGALANDNDTSRLPN